MSSTVYNILLVLHIIAVTLWLGANFSMGVAANRTVGASNEINAWWRANATAGRASLLMAYSFGKAQRLLAGVDASIGPILAHGAVLPLNRVYEAAGIALPRVRAADEAGDHVGEAQVAFGSFEDGYAGQGVQLAELLLLCVLEGVDLEVEVGLDGLEHQQHCAAAAGSGFHVQFEFLRHDL